MPIDVQMPDGTVISGVPDNVTKADLMAKYQAYAPKETTPQPDALGRYIANPNEKPKEEKPNLLSEQEANDIKKDYAISSEMGYPEYLKQLLKRSGKEAAIGFEQGSRGLISFGHDLFNVNDDQNKLNLAKLDQVTKAMGTPESHVARIFEGAVSSIAQQLPMIGASIATGSEVPALAGMFAQSFGQTYDDSKREGLSAKEASGRSALFGVFEVVGEKFGLGAELKALKKSAEGIPTSELIGYFTKALMKEVPGEQLTYAGQFAVDKGYGMNPEAGIKEFFHGALETLYGTVAQGGIMMGAGAAANKAVRALSPQEQGEQDAKQSPGPIAGTNQLSLPLSSAPGGTSAGAGGPNQNGLDLSGQGAGVPNGGAKQLNNQLKGPINTGTSVLGRDPEVLAKIDGIQAQINTLQDQRKQIQDPNDPELNSINQEIASLEQAKKDIDRPAGIPPKNKTIALNAPGVEAQTTSEKLQQTANEILDTHPHGGRNDGKGYIASKGNELGNALLAISRKIKLFEDGVNELNSLIPDSISPEQRAKREAARDRDQANIDKLNAEAEELLKTRQEVYNQDASAGLLSSKPRAMNAPSQEGFDFGAADENVQRTIPKSGTDEFSLTAPVGNTGVTTEATPIETPKYPTSKFMFANTGVNPVKNLVSFFKTLKSSAVSENETKAHEAEINKAIEKINEFHTDAKGLERTKRLQFLNGFFDQYSTAPEDKQNEISRLPSALAGMNAEQQQSTLKDISQFPALNTVRGMKDFNKQLDQATLDYTEAKLGRSRDSAILPWQTHEDVSTQKDASELQRLGNISEKYMTPEEKAAKNYLTAHADPDAPFASAMRSAAFDLGADQGPVLPGQNKETAQLFRDWLAKNMHPSTLARFDATVEEYRQLAEKLNKRKAEEAASEGKGIISGKATGKARGAGSGTLIHPLVERHIMANDLGKALRAIARYGNAWQQGLAKKLVSLGLTTNIGYGQQQAFANRLVDQNVPEERKVLLSMLKKSFPGVFNDHFSRMHDFNETLKSLIDLENNRLDVPKETVDAYIGQIIAVREAYEAGVAVLGARGTYMPNIDSLSLNRDRGGNNTATFLHEVLHAATHWALDPLNYHLLSAEQKQAVAELQRTYEIAKELWGTGNEISSLDEFVVEAFTNSVFQQFLKDMPVPAQPQKTLWNKFTEFIRDTFGLNNMLGYTLANANAILQAPTSTTAEVKALNQQGKLGGYLLDDTFRAGPESRSWIREIFSKRPSWEEVKEGMPVFLESLKDSTRKHLLGGLTLRQLQDVVGPKVPKFKEFINSMESMLDDRNAILNKTRDIAKPWMEFQSKNKYKSKILNELMLDATRKGVDPDTNNSDSTLNKAWKLIGEDGQKIYRDVRNFYRDQLAAHIKVLLDRKRDNLLAKGFTVDQAEASQEYKDLKEHFKKHAIEPYFPLRRFGNYWLQIGKGKTKEFYMFESALERNIFKLKNLPRAKIYGKEVSAGNGTSKLISDNVQDFEFLSKLKELVGNETGNTRKELKDNIIDSIEQMYLQTLPDQSIRKMFMNREGVQGMSKDMLRAFTASAFRIAYQQSRLKHSDSLYRAVDGAEKSLEGMETDEKKTYKDYIGELEKRLQYIMNPPDTGRIPSFLSNVSFVWYMTSPASALVNMLGVPAMGIPIVGARYGNGKTALVMTNYARKFATTGFKGKDDKWAFPSFLNKPDIFNERQQRAFEQFIADGLIDITLTHDIVGLSETPSNLYTGRTQKVMQVLSAAFHGAEKFNREVVAMSAFDLAYEHAKKSTSEGGLGLSEEAAVKRAIDEAKELTYKSMFDYSALNKPRFFQGAYAKVFLQFKQFSQQMTVLLARSAYEGFMQKFDAKDRKDIGTLINSTRTSDGQQSLDGAELNKAIDKYIKDFRAEGKKRLMGTLGTTFIFAGATGLPGWAAFSTLMEMLHYAFADDDEEDVPFDFDNWFKNWAAETFGNFYGDSISRGIASQATGIDFADRMSLNDMWFRDNRKSPDEETAIQAFLVSLMGPTAGLAVTAGKVADLYNQGQYERALETASPAIVKNSLKAARLGSQGALTLSGDELISDFSNVEIAAQAAGFQTERLAQKQKANIEEKNAEQQIVKKHDLLLNLMFLAIDSNDDALYERVYDKIDRFNDSVPIKYQLKPRTINESVKRRYKLRRETEKTGGVKINKNLVGEVGEMNKYGRDEDED